MQARERLLFLPPQERWKEAEKLCSETLQAIMKRGTKVNTKKAVP